MGDDLLHAAQDFVGGGKASSSGKVSSPADGGLAESGGACEDTKGWVTGDGWDCGWYKEHGCKYLGRAFNSPESNCCVCGKGGSLTKNVTNATVDAAAGNETKKATAE